MIDINKLKLVIWDLDDTFWTGTVDNINAHDKIKGYSVEMKKNKKNIEQNGSGKKEKSQERQKKILSETNMEANKNRKITIYQKQVCKKIQMG